MRWRHWNSVYMRNIVSIPKIENKQKKIKTMCVCVSPNGNTDRPVVIFPHFQSVFLPSISFGWVISENALTNRRYWAELSMRALSEGFKTELSMALSARTELSLSLSLSGVLRGNFWCSPDRPWNEMGGERKWKGRKRVILRQFSPVKEGPRGLHP